MSEYKLIMPKMGESIAEATIITWLKNEGDSIDIDEAVLEIATDKVDSEVPSMEAGILVKKLYNEGDVVAVGEAIAIISASGSAAVAESVSTEVQKTPETAIPAVAAIENSVTQAQEVAAPTLSTSDANRFYSPLVMNIARTEKISMQQLEIVPGTGQDGRVTKRDILAFVKNGDNSVPALNTTPEPSSRKDVSPPKTEETKTASRTAPAVNLNPGDEIIEMGRMRKLIADHMVMSKHTSPHVTSFVEADVTNLVNWRNKIKGGFKEREGENFTFTPIFIEAITKAIKDFPMINISVSGDAMET
jgi:2-oxoglutarate dehydrogenase E2 component (dihydrolipoamide succinyltransferase)